MFSDTRLKQHEINHIKTSLMRCTVQDLADELGRSKEEIEKVVRHVKESDKIGSLSVWASGKKKRIKSKAKRKIKGGM